MKFNSRVAFAAICSMAFLAACKQKDKSGLLLPKDAAFIVHIDGASLSSKLPWQEIKESSWFKDAYSNSNDSVQKKLMDDPSAAGIDIQASFAFFVKKEGAGSYVAFEGLVKDTTAFAAFNKKISDNADITRDGDIACIPFKTQALVDWNSTHFVYIFNLNGFNSFSTMPGRWNLNGASSEPYSFPMDSLKLFAKETLDMPGDNNVGNDDRFATMMGEKGDVHLWSNSGQYYSGLGGVLSMMKLDVLLQGNVSAATLNFEDGKISIKSKHYYNPDLKKLMDQYSSKPVSADVVNRIPSQDVVAAFVMNYPPEGLKELLKLIGVDGIVNGGMGKINYSMDEFVKANKGDIVISVSDLTVKEKQTPIPGSDKTFKSSAPDVKFLFAASINDKPAFDKLVTNLKKEADEMMPNGIPGVSYNLNNNWFAAGNSEDYVNKFLAGGSTTQPFAAKIGGHSFGGFIDFQKLMTAGKNVSEMDSSATAILDASLKTWQDAYIWSDAGNGSEIEINLVDKTTNSLKQLNHYAQTLSAIYKAKHKNDAVSDVLLNPRMQVDTTMMVVDSAVVKHHH